MEYWSEYITDWVKKLEAAKTLNDKIFNASFIETREKSDMICSLCHANTILLDDILNTLKELSE